MPDSNSLYRHATRSEIIELAVAEGHDADIPSNAGSIRDISTSPSKTKLSSMDLERDIEKGLEEDIEKGNPLSSTSSIHNSEDTTPNDDDPNIVTWDSPTDPQNPMNWSEKKKWGTVTVVSCITFLTPLASSSFAPGVPQVMETFNSTDQMLEGFMVSVYVLGFAFGPLIIAPLSEMYGRLPLYHVCNCLFVVFSIAAAVSSNMTMFIVFRFIMGCFGGCPLTVGAGTIADIIPKEQRGTAMSVWMMGPTIGPCVGPIIGGYLIEARGWRWNFYLVAIIAGAFTLINMFLMSETYAPVLLERKAARLRKETGNPHLRSQLDSGLSPKELFKFSIVRPTKMLTRAPICIVISIYCAMTYAYLYILFTTFTAVFTDQYHWRGGVVGLSFLGLGLGSLIGQWFFTHFGNKTVAKHIAAGDFQPEHRLKLMCLGGFFLPVGLFWYGWSVQAKTHYMVPMLGTAVLGFALLMTFMPASTYLVDVFTVHAASAMAASTVLRSLTAALIPLSSQDMYRTLGYGWGNSLLAFLSIGLIPVPFVLIRYGERIRAAQKVEL
ncbi:MFS general substrate transporter [Sporormia fimetaria CBS 119925]|uniref:MFS general substrate transporter n=1 Tax=Sporormia fimetaria CBS 119925 TaxID=1340428 RepID=A0A6A6VQY5_9PLEO|nr:MFS general substrate transporter [Sporormia fimetaria CBS 119925]